MATITTRSGKGSTLTFSEMDNNFTNLNTDKIELTDLSVTTASASGGGALAYNNSTGVLTFTPAVAGTTTTINNNADNRVITGSGTANTLEAESNFTFDGTTVGITTTSTNDALLLTTTEDSSTAAPVLTFKRNSSSPANGDYLGQLKFKGENDADQEVVYAKITAKISDDTDTTEDGLIEFANRKAGSNNIGMRLTSTELKMLNGTKLDMGSHQIDDASQILVNNAPTFTESSAPIQLTGTQPNAGGYYTHTSINTQTSRGGIGYRSNTAAGGSQKVDTHMLYFDLDDDYGLRPTGAFQGDRNIWFQGNHTNDRVDMFFDGFSTAAIQAFGHGGNGYGYQDIDIVGANVRLKGAGTTIATVSSSALTFNAGKLDMNGENIDMGGATIDLEGGSITSTGGNIAFADNMTVDINSAGTVTLGVTNTSATGNGNRITVGTPSTAVHSSGDLFLARRATSSGYQEVFKVNSNGTNANEAVITMTNIDALTNQDTGTPSDTSTPTGYIELLINGTQRFIPYYT